MFKTIAHVSIALLFAIQLSGQEASENLANLKDSDTRREEIQRYFGYEDLFFRYTTLPYDVSQNVNQAGRFVDIGFLLIILFPIVILGLVYKRKKLFYAMLITQLFFITSCFIYSFISIDNTHYSIAELRDNPQDNLGILDSFLSLIYQFSDFIFGGIIDSVNSIIIHNNTLVYILLFLIFLTLISRIKRSNNKYALWVIFISYFFLWLLLSGGILWYGFLFIPLSTLLILKYKNHLEEGKYSLQHIVIPVIVLWAIMASFSRISYLEYKNEKDIEHAGKSMLNGNIFPFAMGLMNDRETIDFTSPYVSKALDKINADNDFIYMIGTSLSYNISNNIDRIFQDNLLQSYTRLVNEYEEKGVLIDALKASNFKYIIVDLHTPSLDNTPERSLTEKFKLLLQSLYQNPSVSLIATDRVVEFVDSQGNAQRIANVFGHKMINFGSYAIYEIL